MHKTSQIILYLFLTAFLWASLGIGGKFALQFYNWQTTLVRRAIFTFIFLLPFIIKSFEIKYIKQWQFRIIWLTSVLNIVLFTFGIQYTTAWMGQLMYLSIPFLTVALSFFVLQTKPERYQLVGMLICTVGVLLLQSNKILQIEGVSLYGNLIVLWAAAMHALYIVLSKKYQHLYGPRTRVSAFSILSLSLPVLVSLSSTSDIFEVVPLTSSFLSLVFLWACSLGLHLMTQATNQKFGALISSCVLYIQPVLGIGIAYLVLWENISGMAIIGGIVIMLGAYLVSR